MNNDNGLEQFSQAVEELQAALWQKITPMCEWLLDHPIVIFVWIIVLAILMASELI